MDDLLGYLPPPATPNDWLSYATIAWNGESESNPVATEVAGILVAMVDLVDEISNGTPEGRALARKALEELRSSVKKSSRRRERANVGGKLGPVSGRNARRIDILRGIVNFAFEVNDPVDPDPLDPEHIGARLALGITNHQKSLGLPTITNETELADEINARVRGRGRRTEREYKIVVIYDRESCLKDALVAAGLTESTAKNWVSGVVK